MLHNNENVNMHNEKNVNDFTIKFIVQGHFTNFINNSSGFPKVKNLILPYSFP